MKPYLVKIYVYAEDEGQAKELERAVYEFVNDKYKKGILVTASRLAQALGKFKDNFFVNNFFKQ